MKKLLALVLALMLVLGCASAMAAVFPATPTVYVGYGAGGGTDTAVRPVVAAMAAYMGETINCVNMEGANSAVACDYVLGQPHDGTSMFATGTGGFSSYPIYAYSTSSWQDWISFHPYSGPAVVFANKDAGVKNAEELFAYIAAGNKFGVGAYGNGPHTQFEAICAAKGVSAPDYSLFGSCADTAVGCIAGDVMVGAGSLSAVIWNRFRASRASRRDALFHEQDGLLRFPFPVFFHGEFLSDGTGRRKRAKHDAVSQRS